ncbi:MAG: hypothetical protein ACR5KV_02690 [Wolbachia sp.]
MVRISIPLNLPRYAKLLLKVSNWFNKFGSANSGMHIILCGKDKQEKPIERHWFIIVKDGDRTQIPCVPDIILAQKLISGEPLNPGAYSCMRLVSLEEYLNELKDFNICQIVVT